LKSPLCVSRRALLVLRMKGPPRSHPLTFFDWLPSWVSLLPSSGGVCVCLFFFACVWSRAFAMAFGHDSFPHVSLVPSAEGNCWFYDGCCVFLLTRSLCAVWLCEERFGVL